MVMCVQAVGEGADEKEERRKSGGETSHYFLVFQHHIKNLICFLPSESDSFKRLPECLQVPFHNINVGICFHGASDYRIEDINLRASLFCYYIGAF